MTSMKLGAGPMYTQPCMMNLKNLTTGPSNPAPWYLCPPNTTLKDCRQWSQQLCTVTQRPTCQKRGPLDSEKVLGRDGATGGFTPLEVALPPGRSWDLSFFPSCLCPGHKVSSLVAQCHHDRLYPYVLKATGPIIDASSQLNPSHAGILMSYLCQ